jgi:hypothetical protein
VQGEGRDRYYNTVFNEDWLYIKFETHIDIEIKMTANFGEGAALKKVVNIEEPIEQVEEEPIDINNFTLGEGPILQKMNRVSTLISTVTDDNILYRQFMIN